MKDKLVVYLNDNISRPFADTPLSRANAGPGTVAGADDSLTLSEIAVPCMLVNRQGQLQSYNAPLQQLLDEHRPQGRPGVPRVFDLEPTLTAQRWRERYRSIVQGTARRFLLAWPLPGDNTRELLAVADPQRSRQAGDSPPVWFFLHDVSDMRQELADLQSKARTLTAFFQSSDFDLNVKDRDGRYVMVSRRFEETFGLAPGAAIGKLPHDIFPSEFAEHVRHQDLLVMKEGKLTSQEDPVPDDDEQTTLLVNKFPIYTPEGELDGLGVIGTDITAQKKVQHALHDSNKRFQAFASLAADFFWEVGADYRLTYLSEGFGALTGYACEPLLGQPFSALLGLGEIDSRALARPLESLLRREPFEPFQCVFLHADGNALTLSCRGQPWLDDDGVFRGYRGVVSDITEAQKLADELHHHASHDSLTGLLNRRAFEQTLDELFAALPDKAPCRLAADGAPAKPSAPHHLMCLDMDQFKIVNDTCGHSAGDALLIWVGNRVQQELRRSDVLARLGGDEFAAVLVGCDEAEAMEIAGRVRDGLNATPFVWEGRPFSVSASIGLVPLGGAGAHEGRTESLRGADLACFAAKDGGGNRVHLYRETDHGIAERRNALQWSSTLNDALAEGRFELAGQPIVACNGDDRLRSIEMLLRLRNPDGQLAHPGQFLPAAERFGLISKLDTWVVGAVLRRLADPDDELHRYHHIMINLSGSSIGDSAFVEAVHDSIAASRVPAEKLCFEITETAMIANQHQASEALQRLRRLGCKLALDDFGNGLSNFAYLRRFAVDLIKIDGQFVRDIHRDAKNRAMVEAMVRVSRAFGLRTVAEHIENEEVLEVVREIGIDLAQGYLLGRPQLLDA